jgi:hypothetical protein
MELERGSVLRRTGAFLFDHFLASLLGIIAGVISSGGLPTPGDGSMTVALSVTFVFFFCRDFVKGVSPGRWVAGIMVRDYDDPSLVPSLPKLFLRNVFHVLWPVEALSMLLDSEFRRLGDKAANSVVMLNPRRAKVGLRIIPVILLIIGFIFFTFFFTFIAIKSSEAYKVSEAYIRASPYAVEKTGGVKSFGAFPAGSIRISNGYGEARLVLHVIGRKSDAVAVVELLKDYGGDWKVEKCELR